MARRRKSKNGKWIVTGVLTAALAGGAYLWFGDDTARRMHDAAQKPPVAIDRPVEKKKTVRPAAKVERAALPKRTPKPVAPVAMPVDQPRKLAVPRPSASVGN